MQMNNMCCYVFLHVMTLHCMVLIKKLMRRVCSAVKAFVCHAMRTYVCVYVHMWAGYGSGGEHRPQEYCSVSGGQSEAVEREDEGGEGGDNEADSRQ